LCRDFGGVDNQNRDANVNW